MFIYTFDKSLFIYEDNSNRCVTLLLLLLEAFIKQYIGTIYPSFLGLYTKKGEICHKSVGRARQTILQPVGPA